MKKAINVRTQEQWDKVMEVFKKKGWIWIKWNSDNCISDKNDFYEVYRENTYIRYNNYFTCWNIFNIDSDIQIISFEEFLKEEGEETPPKYRKVYVSDVSVESALNNKEERILITELPWKAYCKYICVSNWCEEKFNNWEEYYTTNWKYIAEIPKQETISIWESTYDKVEFEKAVANLKPLKIN